MSLLLRPPTLDLPLAPEFRPAWLGDRAFRAEVRRSGRPALVELALERDGGKVARRSAELLPQGHPAALDNRFYLERLVKMLLWQKGGFRLWVSGPRDLSQFLVRAYDKGGLREFDAQFMARVYGVERFEVRPVLGADDLPDEREAATAVGGHLNGCRIGFDAGGSDRKVAAVVDGKEVYSSEIVWHPKEHADPRYHIEGIAESLRLAAAHLPHVDAVGISSAGIYVGNETRVASLFRKIKSSDFEEHVRTIYLDVPRRLFGDVPVEVCNDGDVTALAGAMNLGGAKKVLGIAMGTSEAVGYINEDGLVTGWLNELAFAPFDYCPEAAHDTDWSGDFGVGGQYLSQDGVVRLAQEAGIELEDDLSSAEKLRSVQELARNEDPRARLVFETMGAFLGYGLLYYSQFYDVDHILLLGRVTSGMGGSILQSEAERVMRAESPDWFERVSISLPDEEKRRVGQSIAAASLPELRPKDGAR